MLLSLSAAPSATVTGCHRDRVFLRVRLVKKFAIVLNGVDLSRRRVGDLFSCPDRIGRMLVLEGWAEMVEQAQALALAPNGRELDNEEVSQTVWQIIDLHRDGRKDKLVDGENS
jgi:hypothetical protein